MPELISRGLADIRASLSLKRLWWAMAFEDAADSHRHTLFGAVWPLLNYLLLVGALVLILGNRDYPVDFVTYVASGMIVWLFISDTLTMSVAVFKRNESFIKGTALPISLYVMRQSMLVALRGSYALAGAAAIVIIRGVELSSALLSVVPAIALILLTAPAVGILLGVAAIYFRDLQLVIGNAMRLLMFVTPVFWVDTGAGGARSVLYHWNPLTHYLEIFRRPLVEGVVPVGSWLITLPLSALLLSAAILVLGKFNRRIVFQL